MISNSFSFLFNSDLLFWSFFSGYPHVYEFLMTAWISTRKCLVFVFVSRFSCFAHFFFFLYLGSCRVCDNMQNSWITFFTINRCSRAVNCWYSLIAIFIFNCLLKTFQNTDLFQWIQVLEPKFYLNFVYCIIPRSFLIIQIVSLHECQNSK